MDQRRLGAIFVQLSTYWRQVIAANLRIIALEPTLSFTLYNRTAVFPKKDYRKCKISRKKALITTQRVTLSGKKVNFSILGLLKTKILTD